MKLAKLALFLTTASCIVFYACKKKTDDSGPSGGNNDKCAGKTITVTATVTPATKCESDGKLVIRAKGSTGFTFQLNSGTFKTDSTFSSLAEGTYTITAKDADGCTKTGTFTVTGTGTKGASFTFVRSIVLAKCAGGFCHGTGNQDPNAPKGIFATDCDIVSRANKIFQQAYQGNMGNLDAGEKDKILTWINAGGGYTD